MNIDLEAHGWSMCPYGSPLWFHPDYRHQAPDIALKIQEALLAAASPQPQEYEPGQVWENTGGGCPILILEGGKAVSLTNFDHWPHSSKPPAGVRFLGMFKDVYQ